MAMSQEYLQYVLEQLAALGDLSARRMFGGAGLYFEEVFFALISRDTLYFKVGDSNRREYLARRMEPFRPYQNKPHTSLSYYQVPAEVLEDAEELVAWARAAISAAKTSMDARARRPRSH